MLSVDLERGVFTPPVPVHLDAPPGAVAAIIAYNQRVTPKDGGRNAASCPSEVRT